MGICECGMLRVFRVDVKIDHWQRLHCTICFLKGGFKHIIISSLPTLLSTYMNLFKVKGREPFDVLMVGQHWSAFQNHDVSEYVGFTHSCHFFSKYSIFKERGDDANLCTYFFTWSLVLDLQIPIISLRTLP